MAGQVEDKNQTIQIDRLFNTFIFSWNIIPTVHKTKQANPRQLLKI